MKSSRIQQVLAAAATLPAAKGRVLVAALAISAKEPVPPEPELDSLMAALREDLKPLGKALASALASEDMPAMQAALVKISKDMPELAGDAAALSEDLSTRFLNAWLGNDQN